MSEELTKQTVANLIELIRSRAVSPVEVVEAHLERIARLNPQLNAVVTLAPDAMERAREAESAIMRGENVGPLHGLPFTVKDTIETKDLRTTSGSVFRADYIPQKDATAVAHMKSAGAILVGKTNVSEMAMDYESVNPVFGRTNNPHDLSLTAGGSSGGEAAAISSCLSPAGLGSDLAGSIRLPAHFCGICGLKPTVGRVAGDGQFPPGIGPYSLGATIGPMARRVEDLALLLKVLDETNDSTPAADSVRDAEKIDLRNVRVAFYTDDGVTPVSDETRDAVEAAALALERAGLEVLECRPPAVEHGPSLWLKIFSQASVAQLREVYEGQEEKAGDFIQWRLANAAKNAPPPLDEYIKAWMERDRLRASLVEWMLKTPLILAPAGATTAFKHDARKVNVCGREVGTFRAFGYLHTFNVFDLPSVCVPVARSREGLPIGVQVVARPFHEEAALAAALRLERALGGWQLPPLALSNDTENPL
ncbi:MAG: amidase [Pyrinomonadaceae bacterium]